MSASVLVIGVKVRPSTQHRGAFVIDIDPGGQMTTNRDGVRSAIIAMRILTNGLSGQYASVWVDVEPKEFDVEVPSRFARFGFGVGDREG